jgi:hypothetical protein
MSDIGVLILPNLEWIETHIPLDNSVSFYYDASELKQSQCRKKVVFDYILQHSAHSVPIHKRVSEYLEYADKVVVLNSDYTPELAENMLNYCEQIDLDNVELITTGAINYIPKRMKISRYENFFGTLQSLYLRLNRNLIDELFPFTEKQYHFDALLGLKRPARDWLFEKISSSKGKFLISYYGQNNENKHSRFLFPSDTQVPNDPNFYSGSIVNYHGIDTNLSHVIPLNIYNQTAFSIVTETTTRNDLSFYTEKTAKALFTKRLAVYFCGAYHLKNLRTLGFKTFDSIIDESYDNELDNELRWQKAFQQVEFLCEQKQSDVFEKIKPIVEHNYDRFMSVEWLEEYKDKLVFSILN